MALIDCGNGVRLERGVQYMLEDGTVLVSDHYYPRGTGPWPTLLMRQPYGRDIASTVVYAHPVWFAAHGYHVVIQDVRGRGDSTGDFYPFRHEASDGADTIAWLRQKHQACNGQLAMYGFSYQGATQLLAASERPEGLACIAPHMTAADLYNGWFYHHGALRLSTTLGWGIQMLREDAQRKGLREASYKLEEAWRAIRTQAPIAPYAAHPALTDPDLPQYVQDWIAHRQQDDYWTDLSVDMSSQVICVPALHIAGWFDPYLTGSIDTYIDLRKRAGTALARDSQFLIVGPWVHIPWGDRVGDTALGPAASLDTDAILLRWFNHWLKDGEAFAGEPRVRYFTLGPNEWRSSDEWGSESACTLYLRSSGRANSRKGDGALSVGAPESDEPRDIFVYDPEVPVLAPGGVQALSGPFDQSAMELGNNLLVYTSEPAGREMEVFGHASVRIYAVMSASNADLTAKLIRVLPSGRAEFLCIGIARSSWLFRGARFSADEIHQWEFKLEPIAFVLFPNECLRLEIASSAFPLYDRNPSCTMPPQLADQWSWKRCTQQILHTPHYPSMLTLPINGELAW